MTGILIAVAALASPVPAGGNADQQDMLWDNQLITNGVMARAVSPPAFPNIRVVDDIFVTPGTQWHIESLKADLIEDSNWTHGGRISVYVWLSDGNRPRNGNVNMIAFSERVVERFRTGNTYFGRPDFHHTARNLDITLPSGQYWIGIRHPLGGGSGTAYWFTTDVAGTDGDGTSTGFFSLDSGGTFNPEGAGWHHAFELRGHEEPTVPVTSIQVVRGERVSGGTISLSRSDDDRYIISARRPTAVGQPSVEVIVEGRDTPGDVTWTSFTLESKVTAWPVRQQIELWSFETNNWHLIHERIAIADDFFSFRRLRARRNEAPGRYVSANGTVRARLTWFDLGVTSVGWTVQIDQAGWHVVAN